MGQDIRSVPAGQALAGHALFRSFDLDETRSHVSRVFKPHHLSVFGAQQQVRAAMDHVRIGGISVNRLAHGANVLIEPDCLEDFFLVQMPLTGVADIRCGREQVRSTPLVASVLSPSLPCSMRWHQGCEQILIRIERTALEEACRRHLGHDLAQPIEFTLAMDLSVPESGAWRQLVAMLIADCQGHATFARSPLWAAQLEQLVMSALLLNQTSNWQTRIILPACSPQPRHVKRAREYLEEHLAEPINVNDLARHAGCSVRSLYAGFRQFCGLSPMAVLRNARLQRVREELSNACESKAPVRIADVALAWGFAHLGHFTAHYRALFGETPSSTLRRGQR